MVRVVSEMCHRRFPPPTTADIEVDALVVSTLFVAETNFRWLVVSEGPCPVVHVAYHFRVAFLAGLAKMSQG